MAIFAGRLYENRNLNNIFMKILKLLFSVILIFLISCNKKQTTEINSDFKKYYDRYNVEGTFALYDQKNNKYILYNPEQFRQEFIPASTFKICNSLIGLETGIIKDENFVIKWDCVQRKNPNWNGDQDMKTAFKNSTVWYYQELAKRVGGKQMKHWLDTADYGNADTSGGIDKFWLTGGLRITPEQQIDFLKRLQKNELPFSKRSVEIVKKIMIARDTPGYIIREKSGWGVQDNKDIGWYTGYLETNDNVFYFANCIQTGNPDNKEFANARIDIVYSIVEEQKLLDKK